MFVRPRILYFYLVLPLSYFYIVTYTMINYIVLNKRLKLIELSFNLIFYGLILALIPFFYNELTGINIANDYILSIKFLYIVNTAFSFLAVRSQEELLLEWEGLQRTQRKE